MGNGRIVNGITYESIIHEKSLIQKVKLNIKLKIAMFLIEFYFKENCKKHL